MNDRLTEIKARVAEAQTHSVRNDPLFSDLEFALGEIERLTARSAELEKQLGIGVLSQFKEGTRYENKLSGLRSSLLRQADFNDGQAAGHKYRGEDIAAELCQQFANEARAALEESK